MKSKQEKKVKDEMGPFLEEGEEVRAVLIARPRGWTQSMAGGKTLGVGQALGGRQQQKARAEFARSQRLPPAAVRPAHQRPVLIGREAISRSRQTRSSL